MSLIEKSTTELVDLIKTKQTSAQEVVQAHLNRIEKYDDELGAFLTLRADESLAQAQKIDGKIAQGKEVGALAGIPVAVKDNINLEGCRTTCASKMLSEYSPPYSAHVCQKLQAADAIIIGKANLDEFAMGSTNESSALKVTRNPWQKKCVPGGSSGGPAVAVAAGLAPLGLGSDTGGSIRLPASFCGVVGLKPTYGMISRYGLVAFGSSLDQIGPFARNVEDAALLLSVVGGYDQRDSTSINKPLPDFSVSLANDIKGLKIGLPQEYFETEGLDEEVRQSVMKAVEFYKENEAEIINITLPNLKYAVATYYVICTAEASSNLARYDGAHYGHSTKEAEDIIELFSRTRDEAFGAEVKRRIMLGTYVLSAGYYDAYYLRALRVRNLIAKDFEKAFEQVDVIASPTSPGTAFGLGELVNDPLRMYLSDIYTISANLCAMPAISVPCGFAQNKLPISIQLMAARQKDDMLLQCAAMYERHADYRNQLAPLE